MTINHHYLPVSMTLSFVNHSRQSEVMEKQLSLSKRKINYIWDEIIRAEIAKYAAASGFLLAKGIWHSNQYNAFNLIDDFIEPFRPMVDEAVIPVISESTKLSSSQRKALASIPFNKCIINEHETTIVNAIEIMILSIRSYILDQSDKLLLPTLLPLEHIGSIIE